MKTPLNILNRIAKNILIIPIRFYKRFISPCFPAQCKYYPTCSNYAIKAIEMHGIFMGSILAAWRIIRCNPWSMGGIDHVPEKISKEYFFNRRK